jgi:hypothetical protein
MANTGITLDPGLALGAYSDQSLAFGEELTLGVGGHGRRYPRMGIRELRITAAQQGHGDEPRRASEPNKHRFRITQPERNVTLRGNINYCIN